MFFLSRSKGSPVERFSGLLSVRDRALSVFQRAHQQLHTSIAKIEGEIADCKDRHQKKLDEAKAEKEAADFLAFEASKAKATADKLGQILGA